MRDNRLRADPVGVCPPQKDEPTALAGDGGFSGQIRTGSEDSAGIAAAAQATELVADKKFSTLCAVMALAGWELTRTETGADSPPRFYASRWNMVRGLDTLADVEDFARRVGVRA